jgi:hypothetical protein
MRLSPDRSSRSPWINAASKPESSHYLNGTERSSSVKDDDGLCKLAGQPALTGVIVNDVDNLANDQKLKLSEQYTFADIGSALILQDRSYPTSTRLRL